MIPGRLALRGKALRDFCVAVVPLRIVAQEHVGLRAVPTVLQYVICHGEVAGCVPENEDGMPADLPLYGDCLIGFHVPLVGTPADDQFLILAHRVCRAVPIPLSGSFVEKIRTDYMIGGDVLIQLSLRHDARRIAVAAAADVNAVPVFVEVSEEREHRLEAALSVGHTLKAPDRHFLETTNQIRIFLPRQPFKESRSVKKLLSVGVGHLELRPVQQPSLLLRGIVLQSLRRLIALAVQSAPAVEPQVEACREAFPVECAVEVKDCDPILGRDIPRVTLVNALADELHERGQRLGVRRPALESRLGREVRHQHEVERFQPGLAVHPLNVETVDAHTAQTQTILAFKIPDGADSADDVILPIRRTEVHHLMAVEIEHRACGQGIQHSLLFFAAHITDIDPVYRHLRLPGGVAGQHQPEAAVYIPHISRAVGGVEHGSPAVGVAQHGKGHAENIVPRQRQIALAHILVLGDERHGPRIAAVRLPDREPDRIVVDG